MYPISRIHAMQANDRIVFLGDSMTAHGTRPKGYVDLVSKAIERAFPKQVIAVIGAGVGGNKVADLLRRLDRDVLSQDPDLVFVYIGINDVWHWTKPHPVTKEKREGTRAEDYETGLRELVRRIQATEARVVLCTPTVISEQINPESPDYQRLEQYAGIVRQIAIDTGSGLLDLRQLFVQYLKAHNPKNLTRGVLTKDGVHMNDAGNALIADAVCKALGVAPVDRATSLGNQTPSDQMDLYLLIGQSNMAGRARILDTHQDTIPNCFLFNDQGDWEPASNPLNRYSTVRKKIEMQKLGLGYSFAKRLNEAEPNETVGLVVNALGGSKIQSWQKGERLYEAALKRMQAALAYGELKAILWHQGEANCDDTDYLVHLIQMISDFRKDLSRPHLPFIVGQINGEYAVNAQLMDLPNHLPFTACVSSEGLQTQDKWHFDSESQIRLGQRYADVLQSMKE